MSNATILPSVLGRLLGDMGGAVGRYSISLRAYREQVIRDLQWLLATVAHPPSSNIYDYDHVASSVVNYGLRNFAGRLASPTEPEEIAESIREAIIAFEPRVVSHPLEVKVVEAPDGQGRIDQVGFEIIGEIWWRPSSEPISLRTRLDLLSARWEFE